MKKIVPILIALVLVFSSCSQNDTQPTEPIVILPKKIVYNNIDGTTRTSNLTYVGNKLATISNDNGSKSVSTYTGNLITTLESFDAKNIRTSLVEFFYSDGRLSLLTQKLSPTNFYNIIYTYNVDGTVSFKVTEFDATTNITTQRSTGKITISNGNIIKKEEVYSGNIDIDMTIYEYDEKKSVFKNIVGIDALLLTKFFGCSNNETKSTNTFGFGQTVSTTTYTYNPDDFPVTSINIYNGTSNGSNQYSY